MVFKKQCFYFFIIINLVEKTFSEKEFKYSIFDYNQLINEINKTKLDKANYNDIISKIKQILNDYYIYIDIAKSPPSDKFKKVDLINELNEIKIENIDYFNFFVIITRILNSVQDYHLSFLFENIVKYTYISPISYIIKNESNQIGLYLNESKYIDFFSNKSLIENIKKKINKKITKINSKNPFEYIQNFIGQQIFKDKDAQFSFNLKHIEQSSFGYFIFEKEFLNNIKIEFGDKDSLYFSYLYIQCDEMKSEFKSFYYNEIKKYKNERFKPTILDIEEKYLISKGKIKKNNTINWDYIIELINGEIKLKKDSKKKLNVIFQNSFEFEINKTYLEQLKNLSEKINNSYPIVLIESYNKGGNYLAPLYFEKVLNYKFSLSKLLISYKISDVIKKNYIPKELYVMEKQKCEKINNKKLKINIDTYNKTTIHFRTQISKISNLEISSKTKNFHKKERKPTDILIFTDGLLFGASSIFIKNIYESGNAILVGYNGNPNNHNKFEASLNPSISTFNLNDVNIQFLKLKNISVESITYGETFNDSYQVKNRTLIPREYTLNPIDERSNIFGFFEESKYDLFIEESLRILNKYKRECNKDNINLLLLNDKCKKHKYTITGNNCLYNGTWNFSNCINAFCDFSFEFDTHFKYCKKDNCIVKGFFIRYLIEFIFLLCLILFIIIYGCYRKKKKNKEKENKQDKFEKIINKEIKYKLIDDDNDINEHQYNKLK